MKSPTMEQLKDTVINRLREDNAKLRDRIRDLEYKLEANLKYQRRNNILINSLPTDIPSGKLKNYVVKLLNKVGVEVEEKDIEAVHPLPTRKKKRLYLLW